MDILIDFAAKQSRTVFLFVRASNSSDRLPPRNCKVIITTRCLSFQWKQQHRFHFWIEQSNGNRVRPTPLKATLRAFRQRCRTEQSRQLFYMSFPAGTFTPFRVSIEGKNSFDPNGGLKDLFGVIEATSDTLHCELILAFSSRQQNLVLYMLLLTRISIPHQPSKWTVPNSYA